MRSAIALGLLCVASAAPAQDLPLDRLAAGDRAEVVRIASDPTVRARVPAQRVRCRPATYRRLLAELPLAARWLRALDLGDYAIEDLPAGGFRVDDRAGARARCRRALDERGLLVVVARGTLDVRALPTIRGAGVITVRYAALPDDPRRLRARAEVAFRVESGLLHLVTRPFERLLERVLAAKLAALVRSATALAEAIERDPTGTYERLRAAGAASSDLEAYRERFLAF
ncbi:MAG: hypothetical protein D6731_00760 [Planctomycetota bacterium]|nr:MAG: hypothetical protein D6731_00760 [Planctomycetota bacterium]